MKTYQIVCLPIFLVFVFACKPDSEAEQEEIIPTPKKVVVDSIKPTAPEVSKEIRIENVSDYLSDFEERKDHLRALLKSCSEEEANEYYLSFKEKNTRFLEKINTKEMNLLDDHAGLYTDLGQIDISGKHGKKIKEYRSYGLQFWDIGEGYTEIRIKPSEYTSLFSGRVTDEFEEFLQLEEAENSQLITADAGLVISFQELASLAVSWENFVTKYPRSSLKKEVIARIRNYQMWFLIGLDNTPVVEYADGTIYEESKDAFRSFKQWYPNSTMVQLIEIVEENEGDFERMREQVVQKQNELLKQL